MAVVGLALAGRGGIAEPPPEPEEPGPPPGSWVELPPAPVMTPGEHRGVWTGAELVVGGADNELVAYDPQAEQWRVVDPPPAHFGHDPVLTWTGDEMLVWGGRLVEGRQVELAAYDPVGDRWRRGADLPVALRERILHVWAGDRLLVWDRTRGWSYDPAADGWSEIGNVPIGWQVAQVLWAGDRVLVWGQRLVTGPFALAYDPTDGTWTQVRTPPLNRAEDAAALWAGDEALLWGRPHLAEGEDGPPAGFAYRTDRGDWRRLPDAPVDTRTDGLHGFRTAWTGSEAFVYGGYPSRIALVYDGAWQPLPPGGGARLNPVLAWTGEELLVWGGYTTRGPATDLVAWRPAR